VNTPIRVCTLCDESYPSGTYMAHANVHTPVRKSRKGPAPSEVRETILELLYQGHKQAEIARLLNMSRQRVHQVAHIDELGRIYRADAKNRLRRKTA